MSIAVYAGSFDPITAGHLSIIRQAARAFSHLRVLVAVNPEKEYLFSADERVTMIHEIVAPMPHVSVDVTSGLVVEYARDIGATFLVRGIRGASDAEFETELAQTNRTIAPEIATVLLPAEPELSSVSSSGLKALAAQGEDIRAHCPASVATRLLERIGPNG